MVTKKGYGYKLAEADPVKYHAASGKFDPAEGFPKSAPSKPTFTQVFGQWLCDMAEADERLVGITPAMREGSGMVEFHQRFPKRYHDVGIAEQHAVTFAAGLACEGLKPVVAIYSTFLQRGYDQLIHDVALQNLPVVFALDRAGLVGADGPTHAGAYDIAYVRCIPNCSLLTPSDENECRQALTTAFRQDHPVAVRYPRGAGAGVAVETGAHRLALGQGRACGGTGQRLAVLAFGTLLHPALQAAEKLGCTVADMRFAKPLDEALVLELARTHEGLVTVEEGCVMGGAGSAVLECLAAAGLCDAGAAARAARPLRRARRPGQAAGAVRAGRRGHRGVDHQALRRPAFAGRRQRLIQAVRMASCNPRDRVGAPNAGMLRPAMTNLTDALHIPDTQSARDERHLAIQRVGVKDVRYPLQLRVAGAVQSTAALWSLDVALPAEKKGTHMSRFVAWLDALDVPLDAATLRERHAAMLDKLGAARRPHRGGIQLLPAQARAGVGRAEPARLPGPLDRRDARRRHHAVDGGGRAGEEPVPLLQGNLRLRRAQPAFAGDAARRRLGAPSSGTNWCASPKTARPARSGPCSSAATRSGSPSAPTRTPSSSKTWCATWRCA